MPAMHTWQIMQLDCYPLKDGKQNVVFNINWRRYVTVDAHTVDVYGSQQVNLDPSASFTPYAELTEEQVKAWLEDAIEASQLANIDAGLSDQIQSLKTPAVITPAIPWA